jgi:hypothetical protein
MALDLRGVGVRKVCKGGRAGEGEGRRVNVV